MENTNKRLSKIFETLQPIRELSEKVLTGGYVIIDCTREDEAPTWNPDCNCNCGCKKTSAQLKATTYFTN